MTDIRTKLKICGLTRVEEIEFINKAGPDYIGYVFAESRRRIDREKAEQMNSLLAPGILRVGVFVDEKPDMVVSYLNDGIIDIAQLHGNESEDTIRYIRSESGRPVIKAYIIDDNTSVESINGSCADYVLLDGGKGEGKRFDWRRATDVAKPVFLAGGINPDNVAEAVRLRKPYCIDVSSGVERDGMKDPELISRLIAAMN